MREENQLLINQYLKEEKLTGRTVQGFQNIRTRVPKLFEFLEEMDYPATGLRVRQAQEYQGWLIRTGRKDGDKYRPGTIKAYLVVATNFYESLKRRNLVLSNPFREVKKQALGFKLPRDLLKEKEMSLYLEKLSHFEEEESLKKQAKRYTVHVLAELLYSSGLRISEAANLKLGDINFEKGTIAVRSGKGNLNRTAWLNDYAKELLRIYLEQMRPLVIDRKCIESGRVFGANWQTLPKTANRYLQENSQRLDLPGVTSHSFRHALGYHLLRAGCNIRHIQEILGHKHLRNTEIYTKVDKEDLKEVLDTYHPRDFKRRNHGKTAS